MNILCTTALPRVGFSRLREHSLYMPDCGKITDWSLPETQSALHNAQVLIATFDYRVDKSIIDNAPNLELIANFGVGFNNIDLDACRARGIRVTNTPLPVIEPTAELAFALMHDVARRTVLHDRQLRNGKCEELGVMNNLGYSLYGKSLGIIGMGRIGQALARRAVVAGMNILYHNRHALPEQKSYGGKYVSLDELLRCSDFVSLNLPYTTEVHHIIDAPEFQKMKSSAYLINTARGAHVHERALIHALQTGEIAGAALDVYEYEPNISEQLLHLDNVVLSPHTGTGTWEGRLEMCENVVDNILFYQNNQLEKMNIVL